MSPPTAPVPHRSSSALQPLHWAARHAWRDLRSGELRWLLVAVLLAVAALAAVGFFAERLKGGLSRDSAQLLGGDVLVAADQPLPAEWRQWAQAQGLDTTATVSFPSMARADEAQGGGVKLAAIKAVGPGYPLRGALGVGDALQQRLERRQGPSRGEVWLEPALLEALELKPGDRLWLGDAAFTVGQVLWQEPDRGAGFMSFSPRVMMHLDDLPATGLIQPASRVTYRLLAAGPRQASRPEALKPVQAFQTQVEQAIEQQGWRGVRVESLSSGRPEVQQTVARAEKFLNLVALLAALMSAVAVAIAARDFSNRHLDACAVLRVLGVSQARMAGVYALELAIVGLGASVLGVALGWAVHLLFVDLLAGLVKAELPPPTLQPAWLAMGLGAVLVMGLGLPPILQLARVPALRVIRRDLGQPRAASVGVLLAGLAGFVALLAVAAADRLLGAWVMGGFALALSLFAALALGATATLRRAVARWGAALGSGPWAQAWRLATQQLSARPALVVVQVSALSVGLLTLALLVLMRTDLIASWKQATPPDAPNRFIINLQPDQLQPFNAALQQAGLQATDSHPMMRGRLVAINGRELRPQDMEGDRAQRLVEREFNLSHGAQLPDHNQVVAGRWTPEEPGGLSVEEGLATTLKLKLGDTLRFDLAGTTVEGRISSLRKVDWASMRVNFFVLFPTGSMPQVPTTHLLSLKAPPGAAGAALDRQLQRAFPNITNVDVSASVAQVQSVLDQVIGAVEVLFAFTLAAGLVVLTVTLTASRSARLREVAVMRALGAGRGLLSRMQWVELAGLGALAGFMATAVAMALGWGLARQVFEFAWTPLWWAPGAGALVGAFMSAGAGAWVLRGVLQQPVVSTLRQAQD